MIFFAVDDLCDWVGPLGYNQAVTPNMDALARQGVVFSGPGVASGASTDMTVSLIDMYPTFVEMCGLPRVEGLEGKSLANTLHDPGQATDRDVYHTRALS